MKLKFLMNNEIVWFTKFFANNCGNAISPMFFIAKASNYTVFQILCICSMQCGGIYLLRKLSVSYSKTVLFMW